MFMSFQVHVYQCYKYVFVCLGFTLLTSLSYARSERVWEGETLVYEAKYTSRLYQVESQPGAKASGIQSCLALVVNSPSPAAKVVLLIAGSRDLGAARSFSGNFNVGDLPLNRLLDNGYDLIVVEYRGSKNPGGKETFSPPLPDYESQIPNFSQGEVCEYGFGDAYDAVAIAHAAVNGELTNQRPQKTYVVGGSHGGYLALRIARDVPGIESVVAGHPPVDIAASYQAIQDPPSIAPPYFASKPPYFVLNNPLFVATYRKEGEETAQVQYQHFMKSMDNRPLTDPHASLLDQPPQCRRVMVFSNVDDFLVSVHNQRAYYQQWNELVKKGEIPCRRLYYFEFASSDVPDLFPHAVEKQIKSGILSTHNEDFTDSPLDYALWRMLDCEEGEPEFDARYAIPQRVAVTLKFESDALCNTNLDTFKARYKEHPWAEEWACETSLNADGTVRFTDILIGFARFELVNSRGTSLGKPWVYVARENPDPIVVALQKD